MKEDLLSRSSFVDITEDNAGANGGKLLQMNAIKEVSTCPVMKAGAHQTPKIRRPDAGITTET
ncbi:hypothetical protein [uncultured Chryseobacterium sp.]|uniref:hypothetical protein n=1 Tax=uncultured Chryseobacterium sp. TaxID=259322 RepID=UPI0025DD3772|nr:hypothetical protein [uncultured Chryseobacterium sp.]